MSFDLEMDDIPLNPATERLAPVGAADDVDEDDDVASFKAHFRSRGSFDDYDRERLRDLEDEQEQLNSSLLALTTHFAQVQFKLTQVTQAPAEDKERLLKQLEDFAFRGCPDLRAFQAANLKSRPITPSLSEGRISAASSVVGSPSRAPLRRQPSEVSRRSSEIPDDDHEKIILLQREKQQELILQLKQQLEELESYAYECGADITPHNVLVEKQKVIIDELRCKVNLDLNDFSKLTADELKDKVDSAIGQITQPAKAREQLVGQLKTQIIDLERFIEYLQTEGPVDLQTVLPNLTNHKCTCHCPMHTTSKRPVCEGQSDGEGEQTQKCGVKGDRQSATNRRGKPALKTREEYDNMRRKTLNSAKRTLQMLQMFTIAQFGCGTGVMADIRSSNAPMAESFAPMLNRLEAAVEAIRSLARAIKTNPLPVSRNRNPSTSTQSSEGNSSVQQEDVLLNLVRKEFYKSVLEILQHGLLDPVSAVPSASSSSSSLLPRSILGCFPVRGSLYYGAASGGRTPSSSDFNLHPWLLFVKYYEIKGGKEYNESPARKLSDTFGLDIVGGQSITAKHILLSGIHEILTTHAPLKRSLDSQFKAFICLALNQKKLTAWIRLVLRTPAIADRHFALWSFMNKTGGDDLYRNLDKLKEIDFRLPVDMAVRSFTDIKDAF